jgi:two-component system, NtrC family, sensor kinase
MDPIMLGSVVPPREGSVRRHSTTGRTPAKVRHIKAAKPRRTNKLKAARRTNSSVADLQNQVSALTRQLAEAREQQTATADVLRVISSSAGDLQPVFAAMLENAVRICGASFGSMLLFEGEQLRRVAMHNAPASYVEYAAQKPVIHYSVSRVITRLRDTKRPEHTRDLLAEDRNDPLAKFAGARTVVSVPMLKHDELIGLIAIYRREVRPFADKQVELVANFAAQAVIAIENARLLTETREALEKQTATAEVLGVINSSSGELAPVFEAIASAAAPLCDAANSAVFRFDGSLIHLTAQYGLTAAQLDTLRDTFPLAPGRGSVTARAIMTGQVVHVPDLATDVEFAHRSFVGAGLRGSVSVPMLREDVAIGAITVTRQESRSFTDKQIALLENFAAQAVIAIENARLLSKLRESLEQQTATSDILASISGSLTDPRPVFNAIVHNLRRLFGARFATVQLLQGETIEMPAADGEVATEKIMQHYPRPLDNTSVGGQAMLTNQVVQHAPVLDNPVVPAAAQQMARDYQYNSIIAAPMIRHDTVVGAIVCGNPEPRVFDEKEVALIKSFAAQAVIAIENARLLTELRQRTDDLGRSVGELRALGEVSQAVNSTLDLETVLDTIVAKAVQLSNTDAGAIYVYGEQDSEFHLRATYGMAQELIDALSHARISVSEQNVNQMLTQRQPVHVADLSQGLRSPVDDIILSAGYRARLVAPLFRGDDIVGMLVVRRRAPGMFAPSTVDLMKTFAAQSAVTIHNARLYESVEARTRELAASLHDLRTAQDRLIQTEKLASLGQLTAGIAHEIKNPLNFVNNFSAVSIELIDELREALCGVHLDSKLRAEISEIADTLQGNLDKVVQHGKRADSIVKNMLLHSRQGSGEHRLIEINALVEESLNLAYHGARAEKEGFNITLERSFDPSAGEVDLFPQEITRVLLNLISNGFYAATKRKAETDGADYKPTLATATKNLGDRVEIRIRDNGTGIPPEVKQKMFNPFFTTKPAGEGTGLGLSLSYDIIVKQHGGSIEVDTQPGAFSEFRIVLPRAGVSLMKSGKPA